MTGRMTYLAYSNMKNAETANAAIVARTAKREITRRWLVRLQFRRKQWE